MKRAEEKIVVNNITIIITKEFSLDKHDRVSYKTKYKNLYRVEYNVQFGRAILEQHFECYANTLENVKQYLRNIYKGMTGKSCWEGLIQIVPYSWE